MLDGQAKLQLWIGHESPELAKADVMNALSSVEVSVQDAGSSGFQLLFTLGHRSRLQTLFVLENNSPFLFVRVVVAVLVRNQVQVLIDGVVTNVQVTPGQGASAQLVVTGEDLTFLMGLIKRTGEQHPTEKVPTRVRQVLQRGDYTRFGMTNEVIENDLPEYTPDQNSDIPVQEGTDLEYVRSLAQKFGQVFYLFYGSDPLKSKAYWGPIKRQGPVQPVLSVNMGPHTNVENLNFRFDLQKNRAVEVNAPSDRSTRPAALSLSDPPDSRDALGKYRPKLIPTSESRGGAIVPTSSAPLSFSQTLAKRAAQAQASENAEALDGSGSLNVLHYGHVLQARRLVAVRGAGTIFDGTYYVKSVTHSIKRGEYKQNFQLSRNAFATDTERVAV